MFKDALKISKPNLLLFFTILIFIIFKIPYLKIPFYWDEAWSYAVAVFDMDTHGLAFLPGQGNIELTRGHPLLFYFLSAIWVKVFGKDVSVIHLFNLIISCFLIISVYILAKSQKDRQNALITVVLFILQSMFFVQSSMLLPEVMLTLWMVLTIFFYFTNNWRWFVFFSLLLILTKESGIILLFAFIFDKIILEYIFNGFKILDLKKLFHHLLILFIPITFFGLVLIIQKLKSGWFLFPEHTEMIIFNVSEIRNNMMIIKDIFLQDGRKYLLFLSLLSLSFLSGSKILEKRTIRFIIFGWFFIFAYLLFCSMNFFASRYLLCAVCLFFIITVLPVSFLPINWLKITFGCFFALIFIYYTFHKNVNSQDISIGYKNNVLLQKQAINFAEDCNFNNKSIYSTFLMQYYMGIPELGYLKNKQKPFIVKNKSDVDYDVYIFCSNEKDQLYTSIIKDPNYKLFKRFESKQDWVEFYIK